MVDNIKFMKICKNLNFRKFKFLKKFKNDIIQHLINFKKFLKKFKIKILNFY